MTWLWLAHWGLSRRRGPVCRLRRGTIRLRRRQLCRSIPLTWLRLFRSIRFAGLLRRGTVQVVTGPSRLGRLLRHWPVEVITGPARGHWPVGFDRPLIHRLRLISTPCWRSMHNDRPRWQRTQWQDSTASDGHWRVPVSRRKRRPDNHRAVVDGDHCNRPAADGAMRQNRTRNHSVARRPSAKPRAAVETRPPPRRTAAGPRRPSPSEAVKVIPRSALERHIAPRISGHPEVAITRRPHPVPVAVGVKVRARCLIGRPDVALARHVVPVAICVQIVPRWILALAQIG